MAYRANVLGEPFVELFLEKLAACLRKLCESSDSMCSKIAQNCTQVRSQQRLTCTDQCSLHCSQCAHLIEVHVAVSFDVEHGHAGVQIVLRLQQPQLWQHVLHLRVHSQVI